MFMYLLAGDVTEVCTCLGSSGILNCPVPCIVLFRAQLVKDLVAEEGLKKERNACLFKVVTANMY
jgi:hypothetical protein